MGFWFEGWTLPQTGTFERKIAQIPVIGGSVERSEDITRGQMTIQVPAAWDRLDELVYVDQNDHNNDVGSMILLFHSEKLDANGYPAPVLMFEAGREEDDLGSRPVSTVDISGPIIESVLNHNVTYPYDFPTNPTKEPDHIWGGENILDNPNFEDNDFTDQAFRVQIGSPTAGTFTLTDPITGAYTTDPIAYDADNETIRTEILNAWQNVFDVTIEQDGTVQTPWIITITDPGGVATPLSIVLDASGLTGATPSVTVYQAGGVPNASAWEEGYQYHISKGLGDYDEFGPSDNFAYEGTYSMRVKGRNFPSMQQVRQVIPGHRYSAYGYLYPVGAGNEPGRIVIRSFTEQRLATSAFFGTYPTNQWNLVDVGTFIPTESRIIFRAAGTATDGSTQDFYWDGMFLGPGAPPATIGEILLSLWNDGATDHVGAGRGAAGVLSWLVPTFTDTLDSNGDPWDSDRTFVASVDDPLGELIEQMISEWGYRTRIWYDTITQELKWDVFNPDSMGTDYSTDDDKAIVLGKSAFISGPLVRKAPDATSHFAHDDEGHWSNGTNADLEAVWGRRESSGQYEFLTRESDLTPITSRKLESLLESMVALKLNLAPTSDLIPGVHFDILDTLPINLGLKHPLYSRKVVGYRIDFGDRGRVTGMNVFLGADVFGSMGVAGMAEGVRRLLRKISRKRKQEVGQAVGFGKGATNPFLIAASNSPLVWQEQASVVCPGADDDQVFNDLINAGNQWFLLAPGTYYFNQDNGGFIGSGIGVFEGITQAAGSCTIRMYGSPQSQQQWAIYPMKISGVEIQDATNGSESTTFNLVAVGLGYYLASVENCEIACGGTAVELQSDYQHVTDSFLYGTNYGVFVGGGIGGAVIDNCSIYSDPGGTCVYTGPALELTVAGCLIWGGDYGVTNFVPGDFAYNCLAVTVADCIIEQAALVGIYIDSTNQSLYSSWQITGNVFRAQTAGTVEACVRVFGASVTNAPTVTVTDNQFAGNDPGTTVAHPFIWMEDFYGGVVHDNQLTACPGHGILIDGCTDTSVQGNLVGTWDSAENTLQANNTYDCIQIVGSTRAEIRNNKLPGTPATNKFRYAINVVSGNDNVVIGNNMKPSANFATGQYNDTATGTVTTLASGGGAGDNIV